MNETQVPFFDMGAEYFLHHMLRPSACGLACKHRSHVCIGFGIWPLDFLQSSGSKYEDFLVLFMVFFL
jgi:hypothetical protein